MTTTISKKNKHTKPASKKRTGKRIGIRNTKRRSKNSKKSKTSKKNKPKNRLYKGGSGEKEFRKHMSEVINDTRIKLNKFKKRFETNNTKIPEFNTVFINNTLMEKNAIIKNIDEIVIRDLVNYIIDNFTEKQITQLDDDYTTTFGDTFGKVLNGEFGIHKLVLKIYTYHNYVYLGLIKNELVDSTLVDDVIRDVLYKYNEAITVYDNLTDDPEEDEVDSIFNVYKDIAKIVYDYYKNPIKKSRFNTRVENPTPENINMISYLQNPHIDIDMMKQLNDKSIIAPRTTPSMKTTTPSMQRDINKANTLEKKLQELRRDEDKYTYTTSDTIIPKAPKHNPKTSKTPPPKPPRTGIYSLKEFSKDDCKSSKSNCVIS